MLSYMTVFSLQPLMPWRFGTDRKIAGIRTTLLYPFSLYTDKAFTLRERDGACK
ncbi:hypothetical protein SAMN05216345_11751 [Cupriavidus sp. YR651]|nr:hypothetical protein SAMN05216345_11751 [Cupriavidus sp. YR651]